MNNDQLYLQRAIDLAQLGAGNHAPNPRVGAVVVYQDRIIGEGYHEQYGEGHAEVNAIASVATADQIYLNQATIYVTLEPCFHYGKTPPCVDLILKHQIPRVVIGCVDDFEQVGGKSIEKLRTAGVEVIVGVLEQEAKHLARRFLTTVQKKRPYIVLKFAQSKDGYIGQVGKEVAISDSLCKRLVHQWRTEEAAIMIGTTTALVDNPRLDNRHFFGAAPLRIVLDRELKIPTTHHLLDGNQTTWVVTTQTQKQELNNVKYLNLDFDDQLLPHLLEALQKQRVQSVLVEGGATLLQHFFAANLWDECRVITSPKLLHEGIAAPRLPITAELLEQQSIGQQSIDYYYNFDV